MGERIKHLDPKVAIEGGVNGVVMKTTETLIREEAFIDPQHAVDSTKHRGTNAYLKNIAGGLLLFFSAGFGVIGGYDLLSKDLGNNDTSGQQRDAETMLLGAAGAYASWRYFIRTDVEIPIRNMQAEAAKTFAGVPSRKSETKD